jgi:hypothetical protein
MLSLVSGQWMTDTMVEASMQALGAARVGALTQGAGTGQVVIGSRDAVDSADLFRCHPRRGLDNALAACTRRQHHVHAIEDPVSRLPTLLAQVQQVGAAVRAGMGFTTPMSAAPAFTRSAPFTASRSAVCAMGAVVGAAAGWVVGSMATLALALV